MIKLWVLVLFIFVGTFVSACTTPPKPDLGVKLSEIIHQPDVISFPLKKSEHGRWIVPLRIDETHQAEMIIDTGATYSAIFETAMSRLELVSNPEKTIRVHGLVTQGTTNTTVANKVEFGQHYLGSKTFAVLPNDDPDEDYIEPFDGVLGMDVLERYKLYISAGNEIIYFIPAGEKAIEKPNQFIEIDLYSNPYNELAQGLHFYDLSVKNKNVPALLDTGNDVHIINWHAATFVEARSLRSRLRWQWEVAGAIGEFKPVVTANIRNLKSGRYEWEDTIMIIKDTDSLDFIGVADNPFIVAGVELFDERDVFIDFENNKLWLQPPPDLKIDKTLSICANCPDHS